MAVPAAHPVACVDGGDHCLKHRQVGELQGLQVSLSDCRHATQQGGACCVRSAGAASKQSQLDGGNQLKV